jgi:hypothetical protein
MKKTLLGSLVLLMTCAMLMVGCDKENSQQQEPEEVKPVAAVLEYAFEVTDSMRLVADFTISYYDNDGKLQTEQLKANKWSKTTKAALPAKLGVRVVGTVKESFNPDNFEKLTIRRAFADAVYCVDAKGNVVGGKETGSNTKTQAIPGSGIREFFSKEHFFQTLYTVDAEGKKTYHKDWQ